MGRPPLDIGTYGTIRTYPRPDGTCRAETNYRDDDGITRTVKRVGPTAAAATRNLKKALAARKRAGDGEITGDTRFELVAQRWLAEVKRDNRGTTYDRHSGNLRRMLPAFGHLRIREVSTSRCDAYLRKLEQRGYAPNTVRVYRTVLSGVCAFAVRFGALTVNPVAGAGVVRGGNVRDTERTLTPVEREDFLLKLDQDRVAVAGGLPNLLRYMLGTGVRLGEALGLRWMRVDIEEGVAVHGDNLVWEDGVGLVLHEPKTPAGFRVLPLPDFVLMMLRFSYPGDAYRAGPVFPNANGDWRHPANTGRAIRNFRKGAGFPWFTSHVCRHTAITIWDEQGISPREMTGYSGHARPSMLDPYLDRRAQSGKIPRAMDAAMRPRGGVRQGPDYGS